MKFRQQTWHLHVPAAALAAALTACGGGSSSDTQSNDNTGDTIGTVSGTVEAPGSSLARTGETSVLASTANWLLGSARAELTGLQPVGGLEIDVVDLDTGNVVRDNIAQTQQDGSFSFEPDFTPASNHALRVQGSNVMRAPLSDETVDINPVSESLTRSLEAAVSGGASFDDFSLEELEDLVDYLVSQEIDLSTTSSIDDAVNEFETSVPGTEDLVTDLSTESTELDGDYGAVIFTSQVYVDNEFTDEFGATGYSDSGLSFGIEAPDMSFNDDGTLDVSGGGNLGDAFLSIGEGGFFRAFVQNANTGGDSSELGWNQSGSSLYVDVEGDRQLGSAAPDGDTFGLLISRSFNDDIDGETVTWRDRALVMGFRKSSSAPTVEGDYHLLVFDQGYFYQAGGDSTDDFIEFSTGVESGSLTVGGSGTTSGSLGGSDVAAELSPSTTLAGGTTSSDASGSLSVESNGRVSGFGGTGWAAPDGSLFALVLNEEDSTSYNQTLAVGVQKGSSCDGNTLSGSYKVQGLGLLLDTVPPSAQEPEFSITPITTRAKFSSSSETGFTIDYSSNGEAELNLNNRSFDLGVRTEGGGSESASLVVGANCSVTVSGLGATIEGAVTPDGETLVLLVEEGSAGDSRGSRDLVIAHRTN